MKVKLFTNTIPSLGDKLVVSFVDTDGQGNVVMMAKVEKELQ